MRSRADRIRKEEEMLETIARVHDTSKRIIEIAKKCKDERGLSHEMVSFGEMIQMEEGIETKILREHLNGLSDQELNALIGVMYLGREIYCCEDVIEQQYKECEGIYEILQALVPGWPNWSREGTLDTLMGKIQLGEYLELGFAALGRLRND